EISEFTALLERLEQEKREAEKQAMTSGHMLKQLDSEMSRVAERMQVAQQELRRLGVERSEQENAIDARQSEIAGLELRRAELEQQTAAGQATLAALRERRDLLAQNASEHMARVATLEERHRAAAAVLDRISSLAEKQQRETENVQLAEQIVSLEAERNAAEVREGLLQFESEQLRARLAEIEEGLRTARQVLDQARDRRGELSATA